MSVPSAIAQPARRKRATGGAGQRSWRHAPHSKVATVPAAAICSACASETCSR